MPDPKIQSCERHKSQLNIIWRVPWKKTNKFHNYETEKITRKASAVAEYTQLFGSSTRERHARRI